MGSSWPDAGGLRPPLIEANDAYSTSGKRTPVELKATKSNMHADAT
jgi:hypothetical protein